MSAPPPPRHPASEFLGALDADAAAVWHFRTFDDKGAGRGRNYSGTLDSVFDMLQSDNNAGRGVFVVINAGGHKKEDIQRVRAVFIDCDTAGADYMPCSMAEGTPHALVESSPGKWHAYWTVDDLAVSSFTARQKELAARWGTDVSVCDLPRVMRLPGFKHHKGEPFDVRLILPVLPKMLRQQLPSRVIESNRNVALTSIAGGLRNKGATVDEIAAHLHAVPIKGAMEPGEIERIARSVGKYPTAAEAEPPSTASDCSELANALRLTKLHGGSLLAVAGIGWHCWPESGPWKHDDAAANRLAFGLGRIIQQEAIDLGPWVYAAVEEGKDMAERERREAVQANRVKWAKHSESRSSITNALALAEKLLGAKANELDAQPLLVGCPGGVIDLVTCTWREHRREDRITKTLAVDYDAAATAPTWAAFIHRAMGGDEEAIDYLQTLAGYMLSGNRTEHILPIFWGSGANGKSTFLSTLQRLLGDYAGTAPPNLLMARGGNDHPTGMASLQGRRLVVVSETGEAGKLNEELVKSLTGGDRITARRMRQDFYEFDPTHLFILQSNHKPRVLGTDTGIWRRLKLVPWLVVIPPAERDLALGAKLRAELPGILAWAVEGWKKYAARGFIEPDAVQCATADYRSASDHIGAFLGERCLLGPEHTCTTTALYVAYKLWCTETGETDIPQRLLSQRLLEREGIERTRTNSARGWRGLTIDYSSKFQVVPTVPVTLVR